MKNTESVIHSDPEIMSGKRVFVGARVPFQTLLDYLEAGQPLGEFLDDFRTVNRDQAVAALEQVKEALCLKHELVGQDARTVPEMGWASKRNGELLALAAAEFDVFLTVDRNLSYQQDVSVFDIAAIVLVSPIGRFNCRGRQVFVAARSERNVRSHSTRQEFLYRRRWPSPVRYPSPLMSPRYLRAFARANTIVDRPQKLRPGSPVTLHIRSLARCSDSGGIGCSDRAPP